MKPDVIMKQVSCADDYDPASLPVDIALGRILEAIQPVAAIERIPIRNALGRILREDITSPVNVPSATNSAMDGYAIYSSDIPASGTTNLQVVGIAFAGKPFSGTVATGQCVRIMTGAVMPSATDTVVMQEHVERTDGSIRLDNSITAGANVRMAGEDITIGDNVLDTGTEITPADTGLIASLGIGEINVTRKLRVAFFSTGDELRSIGEPLAEGNIYDSNRYTLHGMLSRLGVEIIDMGVIRDNCESLQEAFQQAATQADVLITSGGVSVGEADYVKEILESVGTVNFWKVAMKPGRPLAFGKIRDTWFFGLPGNPVSVMVTFYQFVQPALRYLMGAREITSATFKAICKSRLKKRPGRVEYQRGILGKDDSGQVIVHKTGTQGSGILSSMAQANCFIILPVECSDIEVDTFVDVQPFFGLV
jgi:molybdopterin molybdotransferase